MNSEYTALPVINLFDGRKRPTILKYILDQPVDEGFTKQEIVDELDVTHYTLRKHFGPLVENGILEVRDPTVNHPHYRRGDTEVVRAILSWRKEGGYPLIKLLGSKARRKLVVYFLEQSDTEEAYTKNALHKETESNHSTIAKHIDTLVEAGVVREVDGKRGPEYQFDKEAEIVAFLRKLNTLLVNQRKDDSQVIDK